MLYFDISRLLTGWYRNSILFVDEEGRIQPLKRNKQKNNFFFQQSSKMKDDFVGFFFFNDDVLVVKTGQKNGFERVKLFIG